MWKRIIVTPESNFFSVFCKAIKNTKKEKETMTIKVIDRNRSNRLKKEIYDLYKFQFDWQDDNVVGIEVYKKVGDYE